MKTKNATEAPLLPSLGFAPQQTVSLSQKTPTAHTYYCRSTTNPPTGIFRFPEDFYKLAPANLGQE